MFHPRPSAFHRPSAGSALALMFCVVGLPAAAASDLLVSDETGRIVRYNGSNGAAIDVFVGSCFGLHDPRALAINADGCLLVCSFNTNAIMKYSLTDGRALGAFAAAAPNVPLDGPSAMTLGPDGKWYVSSYRNNSVLRFLSNGTYDGVFIGPGPSSAGVEGPMGLTFYQGQLYVCAYESDQVRRYDASGSPSPFIETNACGLDGPSCIRFDAGLCLVSSEQSNQVLKYNSQTGQCLGEFAGPVSGLQAPRSLVRHDGIWYVVSRGSNSVLKYANSGAYLGVAVAPDAACLSTPDSILFLPSSCSADTNGSGTVDVDDLINVILNWGACP